MACKVTFSAVLGCNKDPVIVKSAAMEMHGFVREQILVNKSDKSDHPHQREPWCFVKVVNKVGAEAMPIKI